MKRKLITMVILLGVAITGFAQGTAYWVKARTSGDWYNPDGVEYQFALTVNIDGTEATIGNWNNLVQGKLGNTPAEGCNQQLTGNYDEATHKLTIATPLEEEPFVFENHQNIGPYASDWGNAFYYVPFAGRFFTNEEGWDDYEGYEAATFTVSADKKTITADQAFGFAQTTWIDYNESYWLQSKDPWFVEFEMTEMADGANLQLDKQEVDFSDNYMTPGSEQTGGFTITNMGKDATQFTVTTEGDGLEITDNATGNIEGGSQVAVSFSFKPTVANANYQGKIIVADENNNKQELTVKAVVSQAEDYQQIVKKGQFSFSSGTGFPFVIDKTTFGKTVAVSSNEGDDTESKLIISFSVPEGEIAKLSWKGEQRAASPNRLFFTLLPNEDRIQYYTALINTNDINTEDPVDISGDYTLLSGDYTAELTFHTYTDNYAAGLSENRPLGFIYDLSLDSNPLEDNSAELKSETLDLGHYFYSTRPVTATGNIEILNKGNNNLKVISVEGNNEFSGEVSDAEAATLETLSVPVTFTGEGLGKHEADIKVNTTAGEFTVHATAILEQLPYDYQQIVSEGHFTFNTDYDNPFVVDGNTAYNSTSGKTPNGKMESWLEAEFDVIAGATATLSWTGHNSSAEKEWDWLGGETLKDGTIITIDGANMKDFAGESNASSSLFDESVLRFSEGHHVVRFLYQKMNATPTGSDRLTLSNLALHTEANLPDNAVINANSVDFSETTELRKSYATVVLQNLGQNPLRVTGIDGTDEFFGIVPEEEAATVETLPVTLVFYPMDVDEYEGTVTIHTTAGDFDVACHGLSTDLVTEEGEMPIYGEAEVLVTEGFETGYKDWMNVDADGDGMAFVPTNEYFFYDMITPYNFAYHDNVSAASYVSDDYGHSWQPDHYLLTPEITIPATGRTYLDFYAFSNYETTTQVIAGMGEDMSAYDVLSEETSDLFMWRPQRGMKWENKKLELTDLAGKTVRIGFHHGTTGVFYMIDDVLIWNDGSDYNGISNATADGNGTAESVEIFTLNGMKLERLQKGVNIVRKHYADGRVVTNKIVIE